MNKVTVKQVDVEEFVEFFNDLLFAADIDVEFMSGGKLIDHPETRCRLKSVKEKYPDIGIELDDEGEVLDFPMIEFFNAIVGKLGGFELEIDHIEKCVREKQDDKG